MKEASLFLMIYGICTILYGVYVLNFKHPRIPKSHLVINNKENKRKVGKGLLIVGSIITILFLILYFVGE